MEGSKEHCNILNVFTAHFDQFNASLLNQSINFFQKRWMLMAGVNERERENDKSTDRVAGNVFESWCNGVDLFWETEENTHRHQ